MMGISFMSEYVGFLSKMAVQAGPPAHYSMVLNQQSIPLNLSIGKSIGLKFTGKIECIYCKRAIKKTYNQGYCFPCSKKLARCDFCVLKPVNCHYHLGTCREPQWGENNCMIPHTVYLSLTSEVKVGITRNTQIPTRWLDQGAVQALPIIQVGTRRQSGYVEEAFKAHISDRTNWRQLLKGISPDVDLLEVAPDLIQKIGAKLIEIKELFGAESIEVLTDPKVYHFEYPVLEYPEKITSLGFDKQPSIQGNLIGIKGQYLILDKGVLNIRKHTGYEIELHLH